MISLNRIVFPEHKANHDNSQENISESPLRPARSPCPNSFTVANHPPHPLPPNGCVHLVLSVINNAICHSCVCYAFIGIGGFPNIYSTTTSSSSTFPSLGFIFLSPPISHPPWASFLSRDTVFFREGGRFISTIRVRIYLLSPCIVVTPCNWRNNIPSIDIYQRLRLHRSLW